LGTCGMTDRGMDGWVGMAVCGSRSWSRIWSLKARRRRSGVELVRLFFSVPRFLLLSLDIGR